MRFHFASAGLETRSFVGAARANVFRASLSVTPLLFGLRSEKALATPFRVGEQQPRGWLGEADYQSLALPIGSVPGRKELFFIDADVADPKAFYLAAPVGATV